MACRTRSTASEALCTTCRGVGVSADGEGGESRPSRGAPSPPVWRKVLCLPVPPTAPSPEGGWTGQGPAGKVEQRQLQQPPTQHRYAQLVLGRNGEHVHVPPILDPQMVHAAVPAACGA
eukprot:4265003-Amphidinium_carterae.2